MKRYLFKYIHRVILANITWFVRIIFPCRNVEFSSHYSLCSCTVDEVIFEEATLKQEFHERKLCVHTRSVWTWASLSVSLILREMQLNLWIHGVWEWAKFRVKADIYSSSLGSQVSRDERETQAFQKVHTPHMAFITLRNYYTEILMAYTINESMSGY